MSRQTPPWEPQVGLWWLTAPRDPHPPAHSSARLVSTGPSLPAHAAAMLSLCPPALAGPLHPGRGSSGPGLGWTRAYLVDGHGRPVELVHLGGHGVGCTRVLSRRLVELAGCWGSVPTGAYCLADGKGGCSGAWKWRAGQGGGGSLIIQQPGMSECDLGRNQTRRGRHPVTRAGSCDLPFNYLPLSRGPVGTRG